MTAREVMRLIERNGGILLRQRGSHRQYEARVILADGTEATARTPSPSTPATYGLALCERSSATWSRCSGRDG
jgi:hypothetical protein